ncbi:MAG: hypothetical protein JSV23_04320 [Promethearchaeota archaeon]|nr:MAG: hypothetical protein JSV23_04320 [Candidatus Lokiarchaeota archaeon]
MKEFLYVFSKKEDKKEPKIIPSQTPFVQEEVDLIDKERELKRWKESFGYYCLNPEKFNFGLKDLK